MGSGLSSNFIAIDEVIELQEALQRVGELVYSQTGGPGDGQAPQEGPGEEPAEETPEETVEGEFREV